MIAAFRNSKLTTCLIAAALLLAHDLRAETSPPVPDDPTAHYPSIKMVDFALDHKFGSELRDDYNCPQPLNANGATLMVLTREAPDADATSKAIEDARTGGGMAQGGRHGVAPRVDPALSVWSKAMAECGDEHNIGILRIN